MESDQKETAARLEFKRLAREVNSVEKVCALYEKSKTKVFLVERGFRL
jgi:hypothetical protein